MSATDNLFVEAVAAGDPLAADLVERARDRARRRMGTLEERLALSLALSFVAAATAAAIFLPAGRAFSPSAAILAIVAYAIAARAQFEVGDGFAYPSQLVLVPMLFVLPLRFVPLCVAAALVLRTPTDLLRGRRTMNELFVRLLSSWHAIGAQLAQRAHVRRSLLRAVCRRLRHHVHLVAHRLRRPRPRPPPVDARDGARRRGPQSGRPRGRDRHHRPRVGTAARLAARGAPDVFARERQRYARLRRLAAETTDGEKVELQANFELPIDVDADPLRPQIRNFLILVVIHR